MPLFKAVLRYNVRRRHIHTTLENHNNRYYTHSTHVDTHTIRAHGILTLHGSARC